MRFEFLVWSLLPERRSSYTLRLIIYCNRNTRKETVAAVNSFSVYAGAITAGIRKFINPYAYLKLPDLIL